MFPNACMKTLWETSVKLHLFVAMSFADIYKWRFDEVTSGRNLGSPLLK
jgi:hypothetical protein